MQEFQVSCKHICIKLFFCFVVLLVAAYYFVYAVCCTCNNVVALICIFFFVRNLRCQNCEVVEMVRHFDSFVTIVGCFSKSQRIPIWVCWAFRSKINGQEKNRIFSLVVFELHWTSKWCIGILSCFQWMREF